MPKKVVKVKVPKTPKIPKAPKILAFQASIRVLGKIYRAEGGSVTEALANLKPSGVAKGMSILTVTNAKQSRERILNSIQTMNLFSPSRIRREIALKNTSLLFT